MNGPINKGVSSALPRVFSRRSAILKIVEEKALGTRLLKNKKNLYVGSFHYFLYTIQIGSNWYMNTGVHDLEVAFFEANST